ncbi:MAG: DUF1080 domain-containing protein [Bacteroidota bacterium]
MKPYRMYSISFLAPWIILAGFTFTGCSGPEWEPLFNGENLDGWNVYCTPADKWKEYWKAHEGYIEANSMGDGDHNYIWLATDQVFSNFHLKLKFQVFKSSTGNSGVQFRSSFDDSDTASNGGWLNGPQSDIHGPNPLRAGLIYDETEKVRRWIYPSLPDWKISAEQAPEAAHKTELYYFEDDPELWNEMEIICDGMHVLTIVNGNRVTDFDAEGILNDGAHKVRNSGETGFFALQLHQNDELKIRFKDIIVKEL